VIDTESYPKIGKFGSYPTQDIWPLYHKLSPAI